MISQIYANLVEEEIKWAINLDANITNSSKSHKSKLNSHEIEEE